jgi:hypothetical protein
VLTISQYVEAMSHFRSRYFGRSGFGEPERWFTRRNQAALSTTASGRTQWTPGRFPQRRRCHGNRGHHSNCACLTPHLLPRGREPHAGFSRPRCPLAETDLASLRKFA